MFEVGTSCCGRGTWSWDRIRYRKPVRLGVEDQGRCPMPDAQCPMMTMTMGCWCWWGLSLSLGGFFALTTDTLPSGGQLFDEDNSDRRVRCCGSFRIQLTGGVGSVVLSSGTADDHHDQR